jgi:hypothetical protein
MHVKVVLGHHIENDVQELGQSNQVNRRFSAC